MISSKSSGVSQMNKIITLALGVVASLAANADLFYWQVATTQSGDDYLATMGDNSTVAYTYAMLKASSDASGSPLLPVTTYFDNGQDGVPVVNNQVSASDFFLAGNAGSYFSKYTGSETVNAIWVELYNGNSLVAETSKITGTDLVSLIAASQFGSNFNAANNVADSSHFSAVPEPTSGLMLLIGAAMLGLRRKKVA